MNKQGQRLNLTFTVADTDKIGKMARAGYTVANIAASFGRSRGITEDAVARVVQELGLRVRYKRQSSRWRA